MDDKQTFHYRPLVVVRMCKSLRKIFSISSGAVWGFGPGRFTQSEPCCHFANISADCALHHHFVGPWVSWGAGERFLPPDALRSRRFLSLNWKHSFFFLLSCPFSGFCLSRGVWRGADGDLGGPGGDQFSSQPLPAASCLRASSSSKPPAKTIWSSTVPSPLIYCWATCVKCPVWTSHSLAPPRGKQALLRKQCSFCIFLTIKTQRDDSPSGQTHPRPRKAHLRSTRYFVSLSSVSFLL